MKREWFGAEMFNGHIACKACGKWDNRVTYSRSYNGRTYEERICQCGNQIVMIEKEDVPECLKN